MKLLVVIPSRGDRPELLGRACYMVGSQTVPLPGYDWRRKERVEAEGDVTAELLLVSHPPTSDQVDLRERVQRGCESAREHGFDAVVVWEDDDYYPPTYLAEVARKLVTADVVAPSSCTYYNLQVRRWQEMKGPSLMEMAWRVGAIQYAHWPTPGKIMVDRFLMRGFTEAGLIVNRTVSDVEHRPVGIKHGQGRCAGVGHRLKFARRMPNDDADLSYLRSRVKDEDMLEFYAGFHDASQGQTLGR